jgi:hypothetical protein
VVVAPVAQRRGAQRRLDVFESNGPVAGERAGDLEAREHLASVAARTIEEQLDASSSASAPSASRPRRTSVSIAARSSGSSRKSVDRLRSGAFTSKNGFSVVAPISVSVPSSTAGSRASCCDLENRWISSRNRIVPWSALAEALPGTLDRLADVLDAGGHRGQLLERPVGRSATASASVVLPVPAVPTAAPRSAGRSRPAPQRLAGTDQMVLADDVVDRTRSEPSGQGWRRARERRCSKRSAATAKRSSLSRPRTTSNRHRVGHTRRYDAAELDHVLDSQSARPIASRRTRRRRVRAHVVVGHAEDVPALA